MTLPTLNRKQKIAIASVGIIGAFAIGRYTTPVHIVTEIKTVEVEKKVKDIATNLNKKQKTTIVEVSKPDGTKEKTTVIDTDTDQSRSEKDKTDIAKSSDSKTEITKGSSSLLTLSLLGGYDFSLAKPYYGVMVQKQVIGPFNLGLFVLSNPSVGASIGVSL